MCVQPSIVLFYIMWYNIIVSENILQKEDSYNMETNRKLRSELEEIACCKGNKPTTALEQLNRLLIEVPTAFDNNVQRLNLTLLRNIHDVVDSLLNTNRDIHNDLVAINHFCRMLRNGIVNRDEFIEAVTPLQTVIEAAAKREQLLSSIADEMSSWTLEQLEAFEALCKTLHRA